MHVYKFADRVGRLSGAIQPFKLADFTSVNGSSRGVKLASRLQLTEKRGLGFCVFFASAVRQSAAAKHSERQENLILDGMRGPQDALSIINLH